MKILIIEDNVEKMNEIEAVFKEFEKSIILKIDKCNNIADGKGLLSKECYDFLILDLNLPYYEKEESEDDAGIMLFNELSRTHIFNKPAEIIVVTSYEELERKYKDEIKNNLFNIVKYSYVEEEWRNNLRRRINYRIDSNNDNMQISNNYEYDMCIITAVEIERSRLLEILENKMEIKVNNDNTIYDGGEIRDSKNGKTFKVVTAMQTQMGMTAAAVLATKMINNFKPRYLVMTGIAAGRKGEGNFGDIIIPTEIWDYCNGKVIDQNGDIKFKPDPKYLSINSSIKEILNRNYEQELSQIYINYKGNKPNTILKTVVGPLACGALVVQNESIFKNLIEPHNRKVKGLDMESYGIVFASNNSYKLSPTTFILKSICDFGDGEKNDNYQDYAAYTSAQFLKYLCLTHL
ncbi:hypothetical protein [Clostridium intestinale]|uniref:phosphorylase family protein n=1 Tax=Clostridium intestinale TaxID=36845 RepID=UPI0028E73854|nr:hypothetical protein [Clostridium intestinale]